MDYTQAFEIIARTRDAISLQEEALWTVLEAVEQEETNILKTNGYSFKARSEITWLMACSALGINTKLVKDFGKERL